MLLSFLNPSRHVLLVEKKYFYLVLRYRQLAANLDLPYFVFVILDI